MPGYIHHVQWSVQNVSATVAKLRTEYGMKTIAVRNTNIPGEMEVALRSGSVTFLVSQSASNLFNRSQDDSYPFLSSGRPHIDTVFNICLEVGDVNKIYNSMVSNGSSSLHPPSLVSSLDGSVEFAAVTSPCDNVYHSLVNTQQYSGVFLPGFTPCDDDLDLDTADLMTHIDHVTYVCNIGDTERILSWYRRCCGMERFLISQDEDPEVGVVFDDVGMKLNVGNWITEWMCREQGVQWPSDDTKDVRNFKLVLAEPLPDNEDSHVNTFLRHHEGPGIQHIGLSTHDITSTINILNKNGAAFRKPPPTYYKLEGKTDEITSIGADITEFSNLGILIDKEETEVRQEKPTKMFSISDEEEEVFLLQIFSFPLFEVDTFFLEIIQRQNSRGFGGGNIRALAQSIIEFQRECDEIRATIDFTPQKPLKKTTSNNEFESLYKYNQQSIGQLRRSKTNSLLSCKTSISDFSSFNNSNPYVNA